MSNLFMYYLLLQIRSCAGGRSRDPSRRQPIPFPRRAAVLRIPSAGRREPYLCIVYASAGLCAASCNSSDARHDWPVMAVMTAQWRPSWQASDGRHDRPVTPVMTGTMTIRICFCLRIQPRHVAEAVKPSIVGHVWVGWISTLECFFSCSEWKCYVLIRLLSVIRISTYTYFALVNLLPLLRFQCNFWRPRSLLVVKAPFEHLRASTFFFSHHNCQMTCLFLWMSVL